MASSDVEAYPGELEDADSFWDEALGLYWPWPALTPIGDEEDESGPPTREDDGWLTHHVVSVNRAPQRDEPMEGQETFSW